MGRPEIMRSGEVSLGDNPAGNEVDDKETQPTDTIGAVPPGNRAGGDESDDDDGRVDEKPDDPDKPFAKFAERAEREREDAEADDAD